MEIRILSAADVRKALPMDAAIAGMKEAYAQLSTGQAIAPLRTHIPIAAQEATTLVMPAYLAQSNALAVKVVSVFPHNVQQAQPAIYGLVLLLDTQSGRPLALMDGGTLTAIRTGAGSGAATDLLARPDAAVAAILGSGPQARTQLEAICTVRPIREVRVYSPNHQHATQFAREMRGVGPIPDLIRIMSHAETAVRGADIICTATNSSTPVLHAKDLSPGVHINGVGSYRPTMQEIDAETVRQALVVVDSRAGVLAEAGDLLIPIQQGLIREGHIHAELGELVAHRKAGRTDARQITLFKSVGHAVQDAIAAQITWQKAQALGLGTAVPF
jgi:ornithine cyclodeaminase/alanine dehydrogenase-like protein (mu-crystallin family)